MDNPAPAGLRHIGEDSCALDGEDGAHWRCIGWCTNFYKRARCIGLITGPAPLVLILRKCLHHISSYHCTIAMVALGQCKMFYSVSYCSISGVPWCSVYFLGILYPCVFLDAVYSAPWRQQLGNNVLFVSKVGVDLADDDPNTKCKIKTR